MTPDPQRLWQLIGAESQHFLRTIATCAAVAGGQAYLVGGPVRDLLREGSRPRDIDVMTTTDARIVAALFADAIGGNVDKTTAFGTATVSVDSQDAHLSIDFATTRTETYPHPGTLPVVAFPAPSVEDDLARRDFTINAMALPLTPAGFVPLLDPFGGLADLQDGLIRVLHDVSFRDDPTRLFRGARYAARYRAAFAPETAVLAAIAVRDSYLGTVSPARKRREIELGMREREAVRCLDSFNAHGLLRAASPALRWDDWAASHIQFFHDRTGEDNDDVSRETLAALWAAFVLRSGETAMERLFADLAITETDIQTPIRLLVRAYAAMERGEITAETPFSALAPWFEKLPEWLVLAFFPEPMHSHLAALYTRLHAYRDTPHLGGDGLIRLGVPKGPRIGKLQRVLRAAWLDGEIQTRADEEAFVRNHITESD